LAGGVRGHQQRVHRAPRSRRPQSAPPDSVYRCLNGSPGLTTIDSLSAICRSGRLKSMRCGPQLISTSTNGVWRPVFLPSIQTSDHGTELTLIRQDDASSATCDAAARAGAGRVAGRGTRLGRRAAAGGSTTAEVAAPDAQAGIGTIQGDTAVAAR